MRTTISLTIAVAAVAAGGATAAASGEVRSVATPFDCAAVAESLASGTESGDTGVESFRRLVAAATESQFDPAATPLTALIPTDAAFEQIPANVVEAIVADEALLTALVDAHVIPGEALSADDLAAAGEATTAAGTHLSFAVDGDELTLNGGEARVVCADLELDGATIHVIDAVLSPPADPAATSASSSSVPGSSVPAFTPEQEAVATAFETAVDSSLSYDDQAPYIEDAEALRATIEAYPAAAEVVGGVTAEVRSVEIDGDAAAITYVLLFGGIDPGYGELDAALVRLDGRWVVPRDEYCAFQAQARNSCPA